MALQNGTCDEISTSVYRLEIKFHFELNETLHDERIITVREEPSLHVESHQRDVTNVKRSREWLNVESRNLVSGDLMKLTLGKSTHIEIRDVLGTFFVSFNGVVQCTIDYIGHVLPTPCKQWL